MHLCRGTYDLSIGDAVGSASTWDDRIAWAVAVSWAEAGAVVVTDTVASKATECKYLLVANHVT
jgi:hypothetical protein